KSGIKLPILKKGEYILWTMKMEQYLTHTDYALWEVILNGNCEVQMTKDEAGNEVDVPLVTAQRLDKGYDRFQRLLSLLEIHGAGVSTKDANKKFLRSLPSAWSNISLLMRHKPGIDNLDIKDLYNNLKVHKADIKGSSGSSSNSQNVAFVSVESTSSTNELNVAYSVSTATSHCSQAQGSSSYVDELMFSFFANQSSSPQQDNEDLEKIDQEDLEEMDLKWLSVLTIIEEGILLGIAEQPGIQETWEEMMGMQGTYKEIMEATDFALMDFTLNPSSSSSSNSE
nr:hypothetical protein [Tanacetum cinerariifolium]